jgi:two-component system, OmpR family, sensor histidine kinase BaeS
MRSLRTKLSLAFIAVAILTAALSATFATYTAHYTFRQYVEHPGERTVAPPGPAARAAGSPPRAGTERFHAFGSRERLYVTRLRTAFWGGTFVAAGIGVLVALWLARRIVQPVTHLTDAARAISGGQPAALVPEEGRDEIAELGRAFNTMAAHLKEDENQRRRLFAGIAHELRTPLSVIQGTLEGMLDHVVEPTPERIAGLHSETLLLRRLITDLRDLSLAQAGQLELHPREIDLPEVVSDAVEALAPLFDDRGIAYRVDRPQGLRPIEADPDRMRQIVQNLVENAVRHTPRGGEVHISFGPVDHAVRMDVTDTGSGIGPDDLPHVFDHFYRADRSRARQSGGTGLGLAIVKSLVEAHHGRVTVQSTPGSGSKFTITLPERPQEAS